MSKLTIHFIDPSVDPITVEHCAAEFIVDNTTFELPAYEGKHNEIVESIKKAGNGHIHYDAPESADLYVFFDTRTNEFRFWEGDGDNKSRGFLLDTAVLLPGIVRIAVEAEEDDGDE
jgi:hypothetical protein